jgi:hypothetical protein
MAIINTPLGSPAFIIGSLIGTGLLLATAVLSVLSVIFSFLPLNRMKTYTATMYLLICAVLLLLVDIALSSSSLSNWLSEIQSWFFLVPLASVAISLIVVYIRKSTIENQRPKKRSSK